MSIRFRVVTGLLVITLASVGLLLGSNPHGADAQSTTSTPAAATPTPGPVDYLATIDALEMTVTAQAMTLSAIAVPTIDPTLLPAAVATSTPSPIPAEEGCVEHVIQAGDTVYELAQDYGVGWRDVLQINGIDEYTILQIDDVLIIPLEGCIPATPTTTITLTPPPAPTLNSTPTAELLGAATSTPFDLPTSLPTATPTPTALTVQIVIAKVMNWGNINTEAVELVNQSDVVNLQGWTLSSQAGESFLFPAIRVSPGSVILVFSRRGNNTPAAVHWGRETAAWSAGDTLTLADSTGQVQATFTIEAAPPSAG